jgi:RNA polymerase sigma-70 factor, ECF subfamily
LHNVFVAAIAQWMWDGIPKNPRSWLISTGRFKAIDTLRRRTRFDTSLVKLAAQLDLEEPSLELADDNQVEDEVHPSPIVNLNRAVAVAMRDGPLAGLQIVDGS